MGEGRVEVPEAWRKNIGSRLGSVLTQPDGTFLLE